MERSTPPSVPPPPPPPLDPHEREWSHGHIAWAVGLILLIVAALCFSVLGIGYAVVRSEMTANVNQQ